MKFKKKNKTYSLPNCYYFRSGIVAEDVTELQKAIDEANQLKAEGDRQAREVKEMKH